MSTKKCEKCKQEFNPSSRHKLCPKCQYVTKGKDRCSCGKLKGKKYPRCGMCAREARSSKGTVGTSGYRLIRKPDHPRAHKGTGYVLEHILVMERELGRSLFPNENIHHINGDKLDNRPENLELWARNQPSGQRISDLVAWAKTILTRYTLPS